MKKILVVEDDSISGFIISEMCAKLGHDCEIVGDGLACLQELDRNPRAYDVILMDIHMPRKSGLEASAAIRSANDDPPRSLPIIAVTADDYWHNPKRCRDQGFDGVMSKPVTMMRLSETLDRYLN